MKPREESQLLQCLRDNLKKFDAEKRKIRIDYRKTSPDDSNHFLPIAIEAMEKEISALEKEYDLLLDSFRNGIRKYGAEPPEGKETALLYERIDEERLHMDMPGPEWDLVEEAILSTKGREGLLHFLREKETKAIEGKRKAQEGSSPSFPENNPLNKEIAPRLKEIFLGVLAETEKSCDRQIKFIRNRVRELETESGKSTSPGNSHTSTPVRGSEVEDLLDTSERDQ